MELVQNGSKTEDYVTPSEVLFQEDLGFAWFPILFLRQSAYIFLYRVETSTVVKI